MPEVRAHTVIPRPAAEVWDFVQEMDNWAPMLRGYVAHEKHSDTQSTWTLTGELGPFTKTIDVAVHVTEWVQGERVVFELNGITEQVRGQGALRLNMDAPTPSAWQRFWSWLLGRAPAAAAGAGAASLSFTFVIDALGPMGPMINPMLGPYADAVAKDLLEKVAAHIGGSK
jgi:carbon monoxide dehydrogenase subunit G